MFSFLSHCLFVMCFSLKSNCLTFYNKTDDQKPWSLPLLIFPSKIIQESFLTAAYSALTDNSLCSVLYFSFLIALKASVWALKRFFTKSAFILCIAWCYFCNDELPATFQWNGDIKGENWEEGDQLPSRFLAGDWNVRWCILYSWASQSPDSGLEPDQMASQSGHSPHLLLVMQQ